MTSMIEPDTDLLLVNRSGTDYKATVAEVFPSVCDLEELPDVAPPFSSDSHGQTL